VGSDIETVATTRYNGQQRERLAVPDENEPQVDGETVIVLQGPLTDLQHAAARLREHGIEAAIGSPDAEGCCSTSKLWLAVAREDAAAAAEVFERDWRSGLDPEQLAALEAAAQIVIDPDAPETTCPACLTKFATGPTQCPECGLGLG
jgi:hypothetical protein